MESADTERQEMAIDQESSEIKSVVAAYLDAYNRADFDACLACYRLPLTFITARGVAVLNGSEEFLGMWRKTHADMTSEGWARTVLDEIHVRLLDDGLAFASVRVTRLRKDGSPLETSGGVYTLRKGREGWKIVANVMQRVENMLRFDD